MVFTSFQVYLAESFRGVLSNSLFMGILLGLIVSDLRNLKWFKLEDRILRDYWIFPKNLVKFFLMIITYVFIIPIALIIVMMVIFFLWLISLII
ncbi:MAG: hypothetical protein AABW47_03130 [Nanoarchaeota archaeon]